MNGTECLLRFVPALLAGSTLVLGVGVCAMTLTRSVIQRKRFATTTLLVFLGWVVLAILPMGRPLSSLTEMAPTVTTATPTSAPVVVSESVPLAVNSALVREEAAPVQADGVVGFAEVGVLLLALGSLLAAGYLVLAWMVLRLRVARARVAPPHVQRLAQELGFGVKRLRVLVVDEPTRPYCFGLRTPTIVLPADLCRPDCRQRLRAVLLHELCHITDQDLRDQVLLAASLPLLYWHPLFWVLRRRLRLSAEMIADDRATQNVDPRTYVRELIELVDHPAKSVPLAPALPVLGLESEFYKRMNMLLNRKRPLMTRCSMAHTMLRRCSAALILTAMTLSWGAGALPAQGDGEPEVEKLSKPQDSKQRQKQKQKQKQKQTAWLYQYEVAGTYPSPDHLEKMLLCIEKLGFTTSGLRVNATGRDPSAGRRFTVTLSCHGATQAQVERLHRDLRKLGVAIESWVPRRPRVDSAAKAAPMTAKISAERRQVFMNVQFVTTKNTGLWKASIAPAAGALDSGIGTLTAREFVTVMRKVKQDAKTVIVQAPKLIALDHQEASIFIGNRSKSATDNSPSYELKAVPHTVPGSDKIIVDLHYAKTAKQMLIRSGGTIVYRYFDRSRREIVVFVTPQALRSRKESQARIRSVLQRRLDATSRGTGSGRGTQKPR